ncbi:MAG: cobalamin-binding protein [Gammaproteobacteria bacterium]
MATASPDLPDAPRIVVLAPHLAELTYAAGAGDRLVATVAFSDFPGAATELPVIGDAFRIDLERLVATRPDVVLAWDGGTPKALMEEIAALDIRVVALSAGTLADIGTNLRKIGALAGTKQAAYAAADRFEARLGTLRSDYAERASVRVYYQVADRPLFTIGGTHSLNDAISLCGGENVFAAIDHPAPAVDIESVLGRDPQVIVGGLHPLPAAGGLGALAAWLKWDGVAAVRAGHVYPLDASLMGRATPRLLDGVARLCDLIDRAR